MAREGAGGLGDERRQWRPKRCSPTELVGTHAPTCVCGQSAEGRQQDGLSHSPKAPKGQTLIWATRGEAPKQDLELT